MEMQIADHILNNPDRHEQNWGFFMENRTGKLTGFCPLFDHDQAFVPYENILSQTTPEPISLYEAAAAAQKELQLDLSLLRDMEKPEFLSGEQWEQVRKRARQLEG